MSDPQQDRAQTPPQHGGADSDTENEFEAPGTNYPDTGKPDETGRDEPGSDSDAALADGAAPDPDHHGQDGGRDHVWAGRSQDEMAGDAEQTVPSMSQNNATADEKVAGVIAQVRADAATGNADEVRRQLAQRLEQAGLALDDAGLDDAVPQITAE